MYYILCATNLLYQHQIKNFNLKVYRIKLEREEEEEKKE